MGDIPSVAEIFRIPTFCMWQVDTYLVLLTSGSDAFFHLKDCRSVGIMQLFIAYLTLLFKRFQFFVGYVLKMSC